MVVFCFVMSVAIPNIGDAITLTGATINPFIGYIFPIMYYLKIDPRPLKSWDKIVAILIMLFIMTISALGLMQFLYK